MYQKAIGELIMSITTSPALITAGMLITYVVVGTFLDPIPGIPDLHTDLPAHCQTDRHRHCTLCSHHGVWIGSGLSYPSSRLMPFMSVQRSGLPVDKFAKDLVPFADQHHSCTVFDCLFPAAGYVPAIVVHEITGAGERATNLVRAVYISKQGKDEWRCQKSKRNCVGLPRSLVCD